MNKDNAKDYLPLVQALADGKTIQLKQLDRWSDCDCTNFTFPPDQYRIKPEPREWKASIVTEKCWCPSHDVGTLVVWEEGDEYEGYEIVRVREILD